MKQLHAALLVIGIAICGPAQAAPPSQIVPLKDSSRLVVIGGSLTEIIYALGEEKRIAARDITANYPPAATQLPDVGYMRTLSPEGVLSINPSAILAIEGSGPPAALSVIAGAGVPFEEVPDAFTHKGIVDKVLAVGTALGVDGKAKALAAKLDSELTTAERLTAALPKRKRVLFVLSLQGGKIMAAGGGTAADGIIRLAGGVNAISEDQGYKALGDEAVIAAKPDAILVMDNGGDQSATTAKLLADPAIALTPAGKAGAVIRMDGEYLLGFGPRTPDAVRDLVARLYPELKEKG